jgi:catechol 2,3-dioxygenase-like lactoylglutathione lyase family enzyme
VDETYRFWSKMLGFKIKLNDITRYADELESIIGDLVEMRMLMAMNVRGGGAIELVRHTSTQLLEPPEPVQWGDIGILEIGLKAYNLEALCQKLSEKGVDFVTGIIGSKLKEGGDYRHTYLRDPDGLLVNLVEEPGGGRAAVGGVTHVALGVTDLQRSKEFYSRIMGFNQVIHESDDEEVPEEVSMGRKTKVAVLGQPPELKSSLPILEAGTLKLVQTPDYEGKRTFEGRRWGDIGCMEFALDVTELGRTYEDMVARGAQECQAPAEVDMGSGSAGSVAYVKDPDGNFIEMVEVRKVMFVSPKVMKNVLVWPLKAAAKIGIA